ncbi:PREDICTED: opioid-binding protein/cell adhesion molecule homolog isoform X1 [Polistes dominula]|uniref:Opioid-binding protein/cell adhesion molecule homolog isoform X1 n=1 Tax=Polistes dominula TaxID=743375 RepID=A0ABM1ITQ3_POLDO|nr:PREDICTED: opioid-binding protein/cell adhesion molecule homolog isoform X1 [Polistes dominula]
MLEKRDMCSCTIQPRRQRLLHRQVQPLLILAAFLVGVRTELVDPKFKEPIVNVTTPVGREAMLSCIVQDLAGYKVAWLRVDTQTILTIANHVITKNHRISVSHSDHRTWFLHIREVRESDRGWYMCQINTDPMKSQIGYLEVVVPPDIVDNQTSTDMVVREGNDVTLQCSATGSPAPNITWRREDGQKILLGNGGKALTVEGAHFNITKVNRLHMGSYLCIATNGIPPSVSKRIMLIVHFPPMITVPNQLVGAQEGQLMTLECLSEAYPKSINYWTRDNDEIVPQGGKYEPVLVDNAYRVHMKLIIHSVSTKDYGSYKCVSRNSLGDTDGSISVYAIPSGSGSNSNTGNDTKYKGKLRQNSGNNILEGNQDMLKEQDLKLRSRNKNGDVTDDYEDSSSTRKKSSVLLLIVTITLILCLNHRLPFRTLNPA